MGLRSALASLFWPDDVEPEPEPAARTEPAAGLSERLKRVGISEEIRLQTGHHPGPERQQAESARRGLGLKQRLQQVGVPDMDAREHARQQNILDASREAERRARREAAYAVAATTCPVPIHAEAVPLPGGLRLRDDEFLVAGASRPAGDRELTVTTHRLIYTKGAGAESQLVVYLAEISDVAFHGSDALTVGTPSGRWQRLPIAGNAVVASRDRLLALIDHARAQRAPLPGGLDELVALRDSGAVGAEEYEARRSSAEAAPRRRRQRQVEVAGKATTPRRTRAAATAAPEPAPVAAEPEIPPGSDSEGRA
ncbi:MAG TPA: hypothetical protein VH134_17455 [Candidatus Dormibacteraeota bacterium]|jgi:hypothetical protein|nr:hypothetical protein [Candidatus Dormibacteraeota bacterium]